MASFRFRSSSQSSAGGGIFFGLIFTAFSSIFIWVGVSSFINQEDRSSWPSTPCEVTKFWVKAKPNQDPAFQPQVRFKYEWEGKQYTGTKIWDSKKGEEDYEDLGEIIDQFHNKEIHQCYVDPTNPSEAVIIPVSEGDAWGGLIFAIFGTCFALIGIGVMISGIRARKGKKKSRSSQSNSDGASKFILIPFCSLFGLAGLAVLFAAVIPMWQKYLAAQNWEEKEATVIWSTVRSHSDSDGTTYSVDIFYKYHHNDRVYKSNSVDLMDSSSSGRGSKQETVNQHPKGKKIPCYVNPDNPHQAILKREMGWWAAFTLFPLPFIAVGVGGLYFTLRKKKQSSARKGSLRDDDGDEKVSLRKEFKPSKKRILWVFGSIAIASFWNGIVSVFLFSEAIPSWQRGNPDWFLTLFLVPFVLVGIGFILHVLYRLMACFNPSTTLTLSPSAITIGERAVIKWTTLGGEGRLKNYTIYLVGEESAQYRRGTDTVTDTSVFYEAVILTTEDSRQVRSGRAEITLPIQLHPSWESDSNAIKWSLRVKGEIAFWPDVNDKYEITILAPNP